MIRDVIANGYCIGCGACSASTEAVPAPENNEFGILEVPLSFASAATQTGVVCPFGDSSSDEDSLSKQLFHGAAHQDKFLGRFQELFVGFVAKSSFRASGSSGGLGKWLLREMLSRNLVDAVIHVVAQPKNKNASQLFKYTVVEDPSEILSGSKSAYYPIEMSGVLEHVRTHPGRYAITGVPCFVKAIRLLSESEPIFKSRIRFCVGMFCGHLKSSAYAESLAWQMGIEPRELQSIDFRKKIKGKPANYKGVIARSIQNSDTLGGPEISRELFGGAYNLGFFQYKACDYCDDVVAETADVSIGDAWLPEYIQDEKGTSIVIVRNAEIGELIRDGIIDGQLDLEPISANKVVESQKGGLRHRREGLAYRLKLMDESGEWRPRKRVNAESSGLSRKRKEIYRLRIQIREQSHIAFQHAKQSGNLRQFMDDMGPLVAKYQAHYRSGLLHRIKRGVRRRISWFLALLSRTPFN